MDRRKFLGLAIPAGLGVGAVGLSSVVLGGSGEKEDLANVFGETVDQQWTTNVGAGSAVGIGGGPRVTADEKRVYCAGAGDSIHALDATDGSTEWTFQTGGDVAGTPNVVGGTVFFGSEDGHIYAVNAATGESRWSYETGGEVVGSPVLEDRVAYVGSGGGRLYALDSDTGERRWSSDRTGELGGTPSTDGRTVAVGSTDGSVYVFDATTGDLRWREDVGERTLSVAIDDGVVYAGSERRVVALEAQTGWRRWTVNFGSGNFSAITLHEDIVYAGYRGQPNQLVAIDAESGEISWTEAVRRGLVDGPPVVVEGSQLRQSKRNSDGPPVVLSSASLTVRALTGTGTMSNLSGEGTLLDEFEFDSRRLAFFDGTLYLGDNGGPVSAIDVPIYGSAQDSRHEKFQWAPIGE